MAPAASCRWIGPEPRKSRNGGPGTARVETGQPQPLPEDFQTKEIADKLCISKETVKSHLKNIYGKLDVNKGREDNRENLGGIPGLMGLIYLGGGDAKKTLSGRVLE